MIYISIPLKVTGTINSEIKTDFLLLKKEFVENFTEETQKSLIESVKKEFINNGYHDVIVKNCALKADPSKIPFKGKTIGNLKSYYRIYYTKDGVPNMTYMNFSFPFSKFIDNYVSAWEYCDDLAYRWAENRGYGNIRIVSVTESEYDILTRNIPPISGQFPIE